MVSHSDGVLLRPRVGLKYGPLPTSFWRPGCSGRKEGSWVWDLHLGRSPEVWSVSSTHPKVRTPVVFGFSKPVARKMGLIHLRKPHLRKTTPDRKSAYLIQSAYSNIKRHSRNTYHLGDSALGVTRLPVLAPPSHLSGSSVIGPRCWRIRF